MNLNISVNGLCEPFLKLLAKLLEENEYECEIVRRGLRRQLRIKGIPLAHASESQKLILGRLGNLIEAAESVVLNLEAACIPVEGAEEIEERINSGELIEEIAEKYCVPERLVGRLFMFFTGIDNEGEGKNLEEEIGAFLKLKHALH